MARPGPTVLVCCMLLALLSASIPTTAEPVSLTLAGLLVSMAGTGFTIGDAFATKDDAKAGEFCKTVIEHALRISPEYRHVCVHNRIKHKFEGAHKREYMELKQTIGNRGYFLYSIWDNHAGQFELQGDGGYINWAWGGSQIKEHSRKKLEFLCRDGQPWPAC